MDNSTIALMRLEREIRDLKAQIEDRSKDEDRMRYANLESELIELRNENAKLKERLEALENKPETKIMPETNTLDIENIVDAVVHKYKSEMIKSGAELKKEMADIKINISQLESELVTYVKKVDITGLADKEDNKNLSNFIMDRYNFIMKAINDFEHRLNQKLDKSDASKTFEEFKSWLYKELQLDKFIKKSELDKVLLKYETTLASTLQRDTLKVRLEDIKFKMDDMITKNEVLSLLKIDKDKLPDVDISSILKNYVKQDDLVEFSKNVYDKNSVDNKLMNYSFKSEILDIKEDIANSNNSTNSKVEVLTQKCDKLNKHVDNLILVFDDNTKAVKNIETSLINEKENLIGKFTEIAKAAVDEKYIETNYTGELFITEMAEIKDKLSKCITKE